jgi:hypothetical protein
MIKNVKTMKSQTQPKIILLPRTRWCQRVVNFDALKKEND